MGRAFNNIQGSFLSVHLAVVKMMRVLKTRSSRGGLGVSHGVPVTLLSVLTTTS